MASVNNMKMKLIPCLSAFLSLYAFTAAANDKPNVLFILADDLGYGGLNCYGTDWLETPNLDRLCSEGMRFTEGYASHPTCQPSRIAILSGQYAPRTGGYRVAEHHRGKEHLIK
jgi:arylsulfatase A